VVTDKRGDMEGGRVRKEEEGNHEACPHRDDESAVFTDSTLLEVICTLLTTISQSKPFCSFCK
jgi:hypothetical protein